MPTARVNAGRSGTVRTSAYEDAIIAVVEEEQPGNSRDITSNLGLSHPTALGQLPSDELDSYLCLQNAYPFEDDLPLHPLYV
jgi:hypothetical protein